MNEIQDNQQQVEQSQQAPQPVTGSNKSNKKLILVAVLALLVIGAGALAMVVSRSDNNDKASDPASTTNVVEPQEVAKVSITSTGFLPATIKIKAGTQVDWTNNDTVNHQIAADPYKTYTTLPELSGVQPIGPNDLFGFTFEKVGTYTYHDELNPSKFSGTVIVE